MANYTFAPFLISSSLCWMRKRKRRSRSGSGRMRAKEEVRVGLGGIHCCCCPLYLYNCTSWFMGFTGVLCVSFAAALGIRGTSFPRDQYSDRFTSRAKTCCARIWIYIYLFIYFIYVFVLFSSFVLLFLSPHTFSYQDIMRLYFERGLSIDHVNLYDAKGFWLQRNSEV